MKPKNKDPFLDKRVARYDKWLAEDKIAYSSKVIPINESLSSQQWVLPAEQVLEIFRNARSIALTACECRSYYQRCDNPLDVCFLLDDEADKYVALGEARLISIEEAVEVMRVADERGLIHLSLYQPDHQLYALCNCCSCCCHDLQIVRLYNRKDLMVQSEYVAVQDDEACSHCGVCIDRCIFDARTWEDGHVAYDAQACYGCGLCVTTCPENTIIMERR